MKKITIKKTAFIPLLLFLLVGTIYAFTIPNSDAPQRQEVGVAFGSSLGCVGTGLCIAIPPERFSGATFDAMGEIIVGRNGKTSLKIDKNSISVGKAQEQFGNSFFEIKKDIELVSPTSKTSARSINSTITVEKGQFPVEETEESYIISF